MTQTGHEHIPCIHARVPFSAPDALTICASAPGACGIESMDQQDRSRLFDRWADRYERSVHADGGFPFDGYERVLDEVVSSAELKPGMTVLDLGIGTGNLAARLVELRCSVWGIDFSTEMLARARDRLPQVSLVRGDLLRDWPAELDQSFDRIVSAYVLHEFDLETKANLLQKLSLHHLQRDGCIVIGDVAFPTAEAREEAGRKWAESWDEQEHYWAADEAIAALRRAGLHAVHRQVSSCGGVFIVKPASWHA